MIAKVPPVVRIRKINPPRWLPAIRVAWYSLLVDRDPLAKVTTIRCSPNMSSAETPASDLRRVLVVDDHPVLWRGLAELLRNEPDLTVSASAASAAEALVQLRAARFDLAIVDISLRGVSGIDLLKDLKIHWPRMPVLVFSTHDEMLYAERALHAGARGYVMKQEAPERVVGAIRQVLGGGIYLSESVNTRVVKKMLQGSRDPAVPRNVIDLLSNRELEVFRLIGQGRGTREIAEDMRVSVKTVETYRAHIKQKLGLTTAPELMRTAIEWLHSADA